MDNSYETVDNSKKEQIEPVYVKKGKGGKRAGAGRRKGRLDNRTIEKMAIKKEFEDRVARQAHRLLTAQMSVALGSQILLYRYKVWSKDKNGKKRWRWSKYERVSDPEIMVQFMNGELMSNEDEFYFLTAEKPDTHVIDSLFDRTFGKAPQNLNIKDDRQDPIAALLAGFGLLDEGESNAGKTEET